MRKVCAGFSILIFTATLLGGIFLPEIGFAVSREEAKAILGENIIEPEQVINILAGKRVFVSLSPEEKEKFGRVPFSEEALRKAAIEDWYGMKGILLWAPPERYKITILELRLIFGTNSERQPFFEDTPSQEWWLGESFAKEVLKGGWHLTTLGMPQFTFDKARGTQAGMLAGDEKLLSQIETVYLMLVYTSLHPLQNIIWSGWTTAGQPALSGESVVIKHYGRAGVYFKEHSRPGFNIGALIGRKPE